MKRGEGEVTHGTRDHRRTWCGESLFGLSWCIDLDDVECIACLRAEVKRLKSDLSAGLGPEETLYLTNENAALRNERERLRAKVENAHLLCASYPVTCPDCGYKWKSGLLSLAAALRGEGEK